MKFVLLSVALIATFSYCKKQSVQADTENLIESKAAPYARVTNGSDYLNLTNSSDAFFSGYFLGSTANQMTINNDVFTEIAELTVVGEYTFTGTGTISTLKFDNFIEVSSSEFNVDVTVNGVKSTVNIQSDSHSIIDFKNDINTLFASAGKTQYWWVVPAIGALVEVVTHITDHCTTIVTQGIASCTTGCYRINFCSVDCYSCG